MVKPYIYLDYNATTPVLPEISSVFSLYAEEYFGNPSSAHVLGKKAKEALEGFRLEIAKFLNCAPEEIVFTSGGTEANHLALFGILNKYKRAHLVVSAFEHPSVLQVAVKFLERAYEVDFVPVSSEGYVDPEEVKKRLKANTKVISIMLANNEIGTIQPIEEIVEICKERDILVHTDACQAVGKIPVDFEKLKVDLLSIAGHKMYAPKGIGALIVRKGVELEPLFIGGGQEGGLRAGTEPLPLIGAFAKACEIAKRDMDGEMERLCFLRERLFQGLKEIYPALYRFGDPLKTLPNTLAVSFVGREGAQILADLPQICASTGSACHDRKGSITMQALRVPADVSKGMIRFSLGKLTTLEEIDQTLEIFSNYFTRSSL
ncbi:MAG: cysteine desulfurase [Caldimicrobium sp.]|nr:cysteine desulfurase [Caldimicrobium sp.]MCX7872903.1 cysteine desulfurase [Caldimicrobium sp.]MDW8094495.1 cysteine desulfurase family protein [Caldimicrobium sp.]